MSQVPPAFEMPEKRDDGDEAGQQKGQFDEVAHRDLGIPPFMSNVQALRKARRVAELIPALHMVLAGTTTGMPHATISSPKPHPEGRWDPSYQLQLFCSPENVGKYDMGARATGLSELKIIGT